MRLRPNRAAKGAQFRAPRPAALATVPRVKMRPASAPRRQPPAHGRHAAALALLLLSATALGAAPSGPEGVGEGLSERAALPSEAVADALALAREAAMALAPHDARVSATAGTLDARLRLAPCARIEPYLAAGQPPWGRTRVGLRCTEGPAWRVFLPVQVQVLAPAVVLRQALPVGARLTEDQLALAEADWAAAPGVPWRDAAELAGRVLVRPLAAGQPPRPADLQPRQWFASGQTVRVVLSGQGFAITTDGLALTPGIEGQLARVRTEAGRVLVGRPTAAGELEVTL